MQEHHDTANLTGLSFAVVKWLTIGRLVSENTGVRTLSEPLSLLHTLINTHLHGALPRQVKAATSERQKYDRIMEKKMMTSTGVLFCGFSSEFGIFLN